MRSLTEHISGAISPFLLDLHMNYINTKSELERAEEDACIIEDEMGCTWRAYHAMAQRWGERAEIARGFPGRDVDEGGMVSFAMSERARWIYLADEAEQRFSQVLRKKMDPLPDEPLSDALYRTC